MPDQPHLPTRESLSAPAGPVLDDARATPAGPVLDDARATPAGRVLDDAVATLAGRAGDGDPALAHLLGRDRSGWHVDEVLPVDRLLGRRVPASCWAVAVVASGTARRTDADGVPTPDTAGSVRLAAGSVRLAVGVDRDGTVAGRLTAGDVVGSHVPASGRLLDTMRRSLRLPTPPPGESTDRLLAVLWLAAAIEVAVPAVTVPAVTVPAVTASGVGGPEVAGPVMAEPVMAEPVMAEPDGRLRWGALLRRHPAVVLLTARGEQLHLPEMERTVDVAAATLTWEVLRAAETRTGAFPLCPPGTAGWMDVGMYARWVLADLPTPEALWCRLRHHLTAQAQREMRRRLTQAHLLRPDMSPPSRLAS